MACGVKYNQVFDSPYVEQVHLGLLAHHVYSGKLGHLVMT